MNEEINIPDHFPDVSREDLKREEDLKAAAKRRDAYSLIRDQQADENNEAIARRLIKDKEQQGQE
jgi:hypothetical protein